jgi:hypothetical protein
LIGEKRFALASCAIALRCGCPLVFDDRVRRLRTRGKLEIAIRGSIERADRTTFAWLPKSGEQNASITKKGGRQWNGK